MDEPELDKVGIQRNMAKNRSVFQEWCKNTSCHGTIELLQSRNWLGRTCWSILILGSLGIATWQVYELILDFLNEPHYRTTTYSLDEGRLPFPNVTLCNFNRVDQRKAIALGMTMENDTSKLDPDYLNYFYESFLGIYMLGAAQDARVLGIEARLENLKRLEVKFQTWKATQNLSQASVLDLAHMLTLQCSEMVHYCGNVLNPHVNCCANATPVLTVNGLCWALSGLAENVGEVTSIGKRGGGVGHICMQKFLEYSKTDDFWVRFDFLETSASCINETAMIIFTSDIAHPNLKCQPLGNVAMPQKTISFTINRFLYENLFIQYYFVLLKFPIPIYPMGVTYFLINQTL